MGKGSEDLGNNLDKAAAANGKGDHDSANVAAAAYAPETDAQSKIKNVQQLNQALQDSGLLPGVSITDTKGQDGESIRLEIAPTDANAHTGLNGSHHTAIYNSTTHELTFQRDAVLPGNSGRENVSVNMVTGQETVTNKFSSASPRQTRVTTRDAVGDAACTDAIVEKYGSSDAVVINTQSFDAQGHPIETEASKTVANVTGVSTDAVKQADVGDCFFESSLASLAATPDGQIAIQNMVTKNGDGSYTVKFPGDKNNPVSISEEELKAESASQNGNRTMAIVETAFMKYDKIGPYNSSSISYLKIPLLADINTPGETLELLTGKETAVDVLGGVAQNFDVGATNPANLASFLQNALSNGDPIVATSNFTDAGPLPSMHIFSVLGFDAKTGTVTVRNPWGHNDGIELTSTVDDITNIGDGQLRMPLSTFMMHFNNVAAAGTNQVDNQFNNVANDLKRHANDVVSAGNNLVEGNISAAGQDAVSAMYNAATTVVDTTTGVINTGKNIFYDGLGALFS